MPKTVAFVTDISGAMEQLQKDTNVIHLKVSRDEKRALKKTMRAYGFQINPYEYQKDIKWDKRFVSWLKNAIWKLHYSYEHNLLSDVLRAVMYKHKVKHKRSFLWKLGIKIGKDKAPTAINPEAYPINAEED